MEKINNYNYEECAECECWDEEKDCCLMPLIDREYACTEKILKNNHISQ